MIPLPVLTAVLLFLPPLPVPRAAALVVPPVMPRAADDTSHLESPLAPDIAADLARFPIFDTSLVIWRKSTRYRNWQYERLHMGPTARIIYAEEIASAEWCERAWDILTDAQIHRSNTDLGRKHLRRLRAHIGDDWYKRGLMPPAAPDWWKDPEPTPAEPYGS